MSLALFRYVWHHPLNADNRPAALARVLRWQLAVRLMPGPIAFPFVQGTQLFATRGMTGATGNWYCGLHELAEMAFVLHLLRPDETFVDIGANIGSYTVLAAGGAKARVVAVEPISSAFERLTQNVRLNNLETRVRLWRGGLSDMDGTLRFSSELDTVNHVLAADESEPALDVPVQRLDDLLGGEAPVLMKIDVEGHEWPVLRGAPRTLSNPSLLAVVMETNSSGARYGISDDQLVETMRGHGFEAFSYDPFARALLLSGPATEGNTVFVRNREAVQERVRSAGRFRAGSAMI